MNLVIYPIEYGLSLVKTPHNDATKYFHFTLYKVNEKIFLFEFY